MEHGNDRIDTLLAEELDGPSKLQALLKARGHTLSSYARSIGCWPEMVSQCLSGDRPAEEIRDAFARDLGLPRAEIDALLAQRAPRRVA